MLTRAGATVANAAAVCAPRDFDNVTFNVSGVANVFMCHNATGMINKTEMIACNDTTACAVGSCCGTFSDFFGTAKINATVTNRRFCVDGTKSGGKL